MADARALLRAERASRRITHPHASYTGDGKLLCNLCEALVKSEAQWQSHLHSTQHNLRSQRQQNVAAAKAPAKEGGAKKRKADSIESPPQERKKARAAFATKSVEGKGSEEAAAEATQQAGNVVVIPSGRNGTANAASAQLKEDDLDTDDIAAFEKELASLEATAAQEDERARQEALRDAATISAAPMTAEELAAQAREEQSAQRGKRDLELEDEREDAARVLEEEMEEMEGLEARVRKLRERREKLRLEGSPDAVGGEKPAGEGVAEAGIAIGATDDGDKAAESSDEEDEDEDFDEWKFGGS